MEASAGRRPSWADLCIMWAFWDIMSTGITPVAQATLRGIDLCHRGMGASIKKNSLWKEADGGFEEGI